MGLQIFSEGSVRRQIWSIAAAVSAAGFAGQAWGATDFSISFVNETALVDIQTFGPGTDRALDIDIFNFFAGDGLSGSIGATPLSTDIPVTFTDDIPGVGSAALQLDAFSTTSGPGSEPGDIGDTYVTTVDLSGSTQAITDTAIMDGFIFSEVQFDIVNTSVDTAFRLVFEVRVEGSASIEVDSPVFDSVTLNPINSGPAGSFGDPVSPDLLFSSSQTPSGDINEVFSLVDTFVVDLLPNGGVIPDELVDLLPDDFDSIDEFFVGRTGADIEFQAFSRVPTPGSGVLLIAAAGLAMTKRRLTSSASR
ncbi:MAG: hypothetical protein AAGH99_06545 [Planctomycetota bacterium]